MTNILPSWQAAALEVKKDFRFSDEDNFPTTTSVDQQQLLESLTERIAYMLDHDFEFLMQIFYRLDLNEQKVSAALTGGGDAPAAGLATLVIERELQKIETRKRYSGL